MFVLLVPLLHFPSLVALGHLRTHDATMDCSNLTSTKNFIFSTMTQHFTVSYEYLMKPEKSAECHPDLLLVDGVWHETRLAHACGN